jgi:hypothetical protein
VYAGSYAYGRRGTRVTIKGGRKRITRDTLRRNCKDWEVLIHDGPVADVVGIGLA